MKTRRESASKNSIPGTNGNSHGKGSKSSCGNCAFFSIVLIVIGALAGSVRSFGDLIVSGPHGIRSFDEKTGAFKQKLQHVGEEQEGVVFGLDGQLYSV